MLPPHRLQLATSVLCLGVQLLALGCTCGSKSDAPKEEAAPESEKVTIVVATAEGAAPVTLVLDPSGVLCDAAVRASAGRRHVLCDRGKEDLAAAAMKLGLAALKEERGGAVLASGAWLVAAPERAAVARSLGMREPSFFSRLAVWVGGSPVTAGLFGPTFLGSVGGRGFHALVLLGPGAGQAESWLDLARRQRVQLTLLPDEAGAGDAAVWSALETALSVP